MYSSYWVKMKMMRNTKLMICFVSWQNYLHMIMRWNGKRRLGIHLTESNISN